VDKKAKTTSVKKKNAAAKKKSSPADATTKKRTTAQKKSPRPSRLQNREKNEKKSGGPRTAGKQKALPHTRKKNDLAKLKEQGSEIVQADDTPVDPDARHAATSP
jgi:hypothetical protein